MSNSDNIDDILGYEDRSCNQIGSHELKDKTNSKKVNNN